MKEIILGIDGWRKRVEVTEEVFRSGVVDVYFSWLRPHLPRANTKATDIYQATCTFRATGLWVGGLPYFEAQV